jgi:single-stranded DNA-binding protein
MKLGKGQQVAIEGRLQTRQWDDDHGRASVKITPGARDPEGRRIAQFTLGWARSRRGRSDATTGAT